MGAVPELVDDGVTGFLVHDQKQAVAAARRIGEIDRSACRAVFERRFSAEVMARGYMALYRKLIGAPQQVAA
jgi:glycosyltransferase involved in cell wall biosynthesis